MRKILACALVMAAVPALASADGSSISSAPIADAGAAYSPCSVIDAAADVPLAVPSDGGPPLWVSICKGQKAPADGVFGTTARAAETAARIAGDEAAMKDPAANLDTPSDPLPQLIPWYVWLSVGAVAGGTIVWELRR